MLHTIAREPQGARNRSVPSFKAVRPESTTYALGLAVQVLAKFPAFAELGFGEWAATLAGQIERGHYIFILKGSKVEGLAGWAFADHDEAEDWLAGTNGLPHEVCHDGDCVILNVWQTNTKPARRFLLNHLRGLFSEKQLLVAKRFYSDGRVRPVKFVINSFVSGHRQS